MVGQPDLGDDVEHDRVTDQLASLLGELGGKLGGRGGIGILSQGGTFTRRDQQGESEGHHVVDKVSNAIFGGYHWRWLTAWLPPARNQSSPQHTKGL